MKRNGRRKIKKKKEKKREKKEEKIEEEMIEEIAFLEEKEDEGLPLNKNKDHKPA